MKDIEAVEQLIYLVDDAICDLRVELNKVEAYREKLQREYENLQGGHHAKV